MLGPSYRRKIDGNDDERVRLISELQNHVKAQTAPYKYPRKIEFLGKFLVRPMCKSSKFKMI